MKNDEAWNSFDQVYCLTLEGDTDRQRHASAELCRLGLNGFKFIEGVKADAEAVTSAYQSGKVHAFPPCFRCGLTACGSSDCNNILIEPQVGCFLSFIKIFETAIRSKAKTFLIAEDDIKFHDHAADLARAAFSREGLEPLGFFSDSPCLIGLGKGLTPEPIAPFDGGFSFVPRRKAPQNPCFAFNRAFAELAIARFHRIDHTVDVFIHFQISDEAQHFSLEPPLSYELSSSTGDLPSKIHPKQVAFENTANSDAVRAEAKARFEAHIKHVQYTPLVVLGNPRCGAGFMARALAQFGLDVGHESMGADGISSWMFAVDDVDLPFGADLYARNSRFVHPQKIIAVMRISPQAVFSLQIENSRNIQSYAFRRRWIRSILDIDLDDFSTDFERALASYVFWYRIIAMRKPDAWICLERAAEDLPKLFASDFLEKRKEPDPSWPNEVMNSPAYPLGQVNEPLSGDFCAMLAKSDPFLKTQYQNLKGELLPMFNGKL
jgi:hypothetical protein